MANAALNPGPQSVFVAVEPCRLFDTRSGTDNVGPRSTPIGEGEANAHIQKVTGDNGNCADIPDGITAVALNVTAVNPTENSFLAVYPADAAAAPTVSNLNFIAGGAPTPNKVDVKVPASGQVKFLNGHGSVNVIADVVGYYANLKVGLNEMDTSSITVPITYTAFVVNAGVCRNGGGSGDSTSNGTGIFAAGKPVIVTVESGTLPNNLYLVGGTTRAIANGIGVANFLICSASTVGTDTINGTITFRITVINK